MLPRLSLGRIVWAEVADANGNSKLRSAVIVTPTERITSSDPIDVVAITSRLSDPLPDDHIVLPWHPRGHPRTGLNRRCAAVCTWLARIHERDIHDMAGVVPAAQLSKILAQIAAATTAPTTSESTQIVSDSQRDVSPNDPTGRRP